MSLRQQEERMFAAQEANIKDGTWPAPQQPTVRSLEGRLRNIQSLERRGLYVAGQRLRDSALVALNASVYQRWGAETVNVIEMALKGLVPVSHALVAMRDHG